MNHALFPVVKSLFAALLAVSCLAQATEEKKPIQADVAKGEALYANGDTARNIPACVACHGAAGHSTMAQNPKLAAQHAAYIVKQLKDFTGAQRNHPVMSPIAKALSDEEVRHVAAYVNAQTAKSGAAKNKETIDLGKKIYRAGIAEKNVPACAGCHGPAGAGIPAQFPRVAGQHQDYSAAQLINFRSNTRKNNAIMASIAKRLSDDEVQAVSDYMAGLR